MGIVIETVASEFSAVFIVNIFQPFEIKVIKGTFWMLTGKIGEYKDMIINVKIVAFERFFIPAKDKLL